MLVRFQSRMVLILFFISWDIQLVFVLFFPEYIACSQTLRNLHLLLLYGFGFCLLILHSSSLYLTGSSISSIMIYAGFGDLLLKGAVNLIWAWRKKFKEGAKELSSTLVGLDNKENMEAVRAMRIEMATIHAMVKAINRKVDLLLAGPTRPVRPTLPLAPPPPLSPKENGEAVGEVNGGSDSEVNGESDGEVNGGNGGGE